MVNILDKLPLQRLFDLFEWISSGILFLVYK